MNWVRVELVLQSLLHRLLLRNDIFIEVCYRGKTSTTTRHGVYEGRQQKIFLDNCILSIVYAAIQVEQTAYVLWARILSGGTQFPLDDRVPDLSDLKEESEEKSAVLSPDHSTMIGFTSTEAKPARGASVVRTTNEPSWRDSTSVPFWAWTECHFLPGTQPSADKLRRVLPPLSPNSF